VGIYNHAWTQRNIRVRNVRSGSNLPYKVVGYHQGVTSYSCKPSSGYPHGHTNNVFWADETLDRAEDWFKCVRAQGLVVGDAHWNAKHQVEVTVEDYPDSFITGR